MGKRRAANANMPSARHGLTGFLYRIIATMKPGSRLHHSTQRLSRGCRRSPNRVNIEPAARYRHELAHGRAHQPAPRSDRRSESPRLSSKCCAERRAATTRRRSTTSSPRRGRARHVLPVLRRTSARCSRISSIASRGSLSMAIVRIVTDDASRSVVEQVRENIRSIIAACLAERAMTKILFTDSVGVDPAFDRKLQTFTIQWCSS